MKKLFILCVLFTLACLITSPVTATINITASQTGDSFIKWTWDEGLTITEMTIDGYQIQYFDATAGYFVLSDLKPMETHIIRIFTDSDSGVNVANTTVERATSQSNIMDLLWSMILLVLGVACILIGTKIPLIGYGGFVFGAIGVIAGINSIVVDKVNLSNFIVTILYALLICASIIVAYNKE